LVKPAGRNSQGRITTRNKGSGHRRQYRLIDFKRDKDGIPGRVATIESDPNRSANIALIHYAAGGKRYLLAPKEREAGRVIESGEQAVIKTGQALQLGRIAVGTSVQNRELNPQRGPQLAASAGTDALMLGREGEYTAVRLTSAELRLILTTC